MAANDKKRKQVPWKITESLRHRLNSHAEYLSAEKKTKTDVMVEQWLEERLKKEERLRAMRTLGIEEEDLPRRAKTS